MLGAECGAGDKINLHQIDWEIWGICIVMWCDMSPGDPPSGRHATRLTGKPTDIEREFFCFSVSELNKKEGVKPTLNCFSGRLGKLGRG